MSRKTSIFHLVQQLDHDYWDWSEEELAALGDLQKHTQVIFNRLSNANIECSKLYSIYHDKDSSDTKVWNEFLNQYDVKSVIKENHIHVLIYVTTPVLINTLADIIGVESQYIDKAEKGRNSFDNLLAYLVHAKDKSKYQYSPDEVITLCGEDYSEIYKREFSKWHNYALNRTPVIKRLGSLEIDMIILKIIDGEITLNQVLNTPELSLAYTKRKSEFNNAFEIAQKKKFNGYEQALRNGDIVKLNFYFYGKTGVGKTKFCNDLILAIKEYMWNNHNLAWNDITLATTKGLDEYNGEQIIFLDDVRENQMSFNEWLRLTDPHNAGYQHARYRNKLVMYYVCFITSSLPPKAIMDISYNPFDEEDISQFNRRMTLIKEITEDTCFDELKNIIIDKLKCLSLSSAS